uniref:synaptotagmin-15-like n=1 Tax=Euleptes europaea TaxID=460621 RepID=UPI00253F6593|nr:synaptotagmin-15-like [Euleptes europaea]
MPLKGLFAVDTLVPAVPGSHGESPDLASHLRSSKGEAGLFAVGILMPAVPGLHGESPDLASHPRSSRGEAGLFAVDTLMPAVPGLHGESPDLASHPRSSSGEAGFHLASLLLAGSFEVKTAGSISCLRLAYQFNVCLPVQRLAANTLRQLLACLSNSMRYCRFQTSRSTRKAMRKQVNMQVFLGAGLAILCFCLLLGCAICWHWQKKQKDKSEAWPPDCTLVDLGPALPSRVTIQQQYTEIEGEVLERPSPTVADAPGVSGHGSPPKSLRRGRASLPSIPFPSKLSLPGKPTLHLERRCTISVSSALGDKSSLLSSPVQGADISQLYATPRNLSGAGPKPRPCLHFTLFYSEPEATLIVTVIGVSHLPKGFRASRDSYVKVCLLPKSAEPQRTAVHKKSLNPEFREQFHFGHYGPEELRGLTLRFAVYAKGFHNLKDFFIGEVMFPCTQATWEQGVSSAYTQELSTTKTKLKKCLSSQDMISSLSQPKSAGQLFLLLQYQALASRIKVLVRKAENLGRLTRIPGTPDHYVMIRLHHNGKVVDTKETKSIAGCNPVWNTPFLFSVPAGDILEQALSLEFTVMQARLYTRSCPVGRVLIGPDAPEMGQTHWKEMCSRGNVESARWHSVQPERVPLCPR